MKLSARVEQAEGASRELDGAIRQAVAGDFHFCDGDGTRCEACCLPAHELTQEPGCGAPVGMSDERTSYPIDWREDERLPRYSASLDAAMTLKGDWLLDYIQEHHEGYSTAGLYRRSRLVLSYDRATGQSRTPALALTAAALRARGL